MDQFLPALVGLAGVVLGVLASAWRQAALERAVSQREDLRRWRQDRREAYLRFIYADDELYRGLVRDLRDPPPGRVVNDPGRLGSGGLISPLSAEQRLELLGTFDRLWRAKREIELFHLVDDELLASAVKLALVDAELVGLIAYDLEREPEAAESVTAAAVSALAERQRAINGFMQKARSALNVPPGQLTHRSRNARRGQSEAFN